MTCVNCGNEVADNFCSHAVIIITSIVILLLPYFSPETFELIRSLNNR